MARPRVLLADDHRMVSEGLQSLLADEFDLVGMVEDGRAMVAAAKSCTQMSSYRILRCRTSTASTRWPA